jgi:hypothetical protein
VAEEHGRAGREKGRVFRRAQRGRGEGVKHLKVCAEALYPVHIDDAFLCVPIL